MSGDQAHETILANDSAGGFALGVEKASTKDINKYGLNILFPDSGSAFLWANPIHSEPHISY